MPACTVSTAIYFNSLLDRKRSPRNWTSMIAFMIEYAFSRWDSIQSLRPVSLLELVNKQFQGWITYKLYPLESSFLPFLELIMPACESSLVLFVYGRWDKRWIKISLENKSSVQIEKYWKQMSLFFFSALGQVYASQFTNIGWLLSLWSFVFSLCYLFGERHMLSEFVPWKNQTFGHMKEGSVCSHMIICPIYHCKWAVIGGFASLVAQRVKNLPSVQETWSRSLGWEDPLEKGMAINSSIFAWRIPWTEEPGGLQPVGLQSRTWLSN